MLLSGIEDTINIIDLQKFTQYKGYGRKSKTVQIFWAVF